MDLKPMGETVRFHDTSEYLDKLKSTLRETEDSVLTGLPPDFLEGAVIQFHKEKLDPRINLPVEARPFGQ